MRKNMILRKLASAAVMSLAAAVALSACSGSTPAAASSSAASAGETLTGTAKGFGEGLTATLTVSDGVITDCVLEGPNETPDIGGAALEELSKQVVAANGPEIDGVTGATMTSNGVRKAVSAAMGIETENAAASSAAAEPAAPVSVEGGIQIGMAYGAAHGTKCFTEAVAVVKDDVILAAYVDEFQFTDASADVVGVPNSDAGFGENYAEGKTLISKRVNAEYYSALMTEHAGATVAIDKNYDAIQDFAVGKTVSELREVAASGSAADAVSGATLADTAGYLSVIADAAENADESVAVEFTGSSDDLQLKVAYAAPHGDKCFATAAAVTSGDTVVLSYIDEFQFTDTSAGVEGVPNSDSDFGKDGYAEGKVLFSKRVNAEYYSALMTDHAGATVAIDKNYDAIQNHVDGMKVSDAKALSESSSAVDSVSGATLADTANYIAAIVEAAEG